MICRKVWNNSTGLYNPRRASRLIHCSSSELFHNSNNVMFPPRKRAPFKEVEATRPDFDPTSKPAYVKTPDPNWKPGGGLNNLPYAKDFDPKNAKWRVIDPEEHSRADLYRMLVSAITPRPIAFVSTLSVDGVSNLAPMSYFNMVCHDPPTIMVSISTSVTSPGPEGIKDTAQNIKDTKEFTVNIISEPFLEAANYTSIDSPPDVDEWALAGLTKWPSKTVKPPVVGESAFTMECELIHWYDLRNDKGELSSTVALGRIRCFQAKEFIFDPDNKEAVLPEKLRAISRLGGITYGRGHDMIELERPRWNDVKDTDDVKKALGRL